MAVIYDLNAYRAPRLLDTFAQQTGSVVRMIGIQIGHLRKLEAGVRALQGNLEETHATLKAAEERLEDAQDLHETSLEAMETGDMEDMMRARDEIAQYRHSMFKHLHADRKA